MNLLQCVKNGDLDEVKRLILDGADANSTSSNGKSALFLACERGHLDVAEFLLQNGADIACSGFNPLVAASRNGHAECVELLLDCGADPSYRAMDFALQNMAVSAISASVIDHGVRPDMVFDSIFSRDMAKVATPMREMLENRILSIDSNETLLAALQFSLKHGCLELASNLLSLPLSSSNDDTYPAAVYHSVKYRRHDFLSELLEEDIDANATTESCSPLFAACEQVDVISARMLLKHGADPNLPCPTVTDRTSISKTPLVVAVENGHVELVEELLRNKADVNMTDNVGNCALHVAVNLYLEVNLKANREVVRLLLESGADPNLIPVGCKSPLSTAVVSNDTELAKLLIEKGAQLNLTDSSGKTALHHAVCCKNSAPSVVKLLLERGADVQTTDKENKSPLHCALDIKIPADDHNLTNLNLLLDYGADVNASTSGVTPLYVACRKNLTAIVLKMLTECDAEVNAGECSPLRSACINYNTEIAKMLLSKDADPNVPEPALWAAVARLNSELVSLLLSHGANVNDVDTHGNTALHSAVISAAAREEGGVLTDKSREEQRVVDTLLKAHADFNISNAGGKTSLHMAVEKGMLKFVRAMIYRGRNSGNTLCCACERGNVKNAEKLLMAGADPNLREFEIYGKVVRCKLPLCVAVQLDKYELAKLLLSYGADVNSTVHGEEIPRYSLDGAGKSALRVSLEKLHSRRCHGSPPLHNPQQNDVASMSKMLLEHGADVDLGQLIDGHSPISLVVMLAKDYSTETRRGNKLCVRNTRSVEELVRLMIRKGAVLDGPFSLDEQPSLLRTLCAWYYEDQLAVELFKSGASFRLLLYCYEGPVTRFVPAHSIRLCQAVVMAGYKPNAVELSDIRRMASGERPILIFAKLLSWLRRDGQEAASLMRQCRVFIRRQLLVVSSRRTILPAIFRLSSLPKQLLSYLKFEGPLSEIDLEGG